MIANTGHLTCDSCGDSYDYAPGSPPHACAPKTATLDLRAMREALIDRNAEQRGIRIGYAMAAAFLARDEDRPSLARELLETAGTNCDDDVSELDLDEYDSEPLLAIFKETE
jgi:hypothetical protein